MYKTAIVILVLGMSISVTEATDLSASKKSLDKALESAEEMVMHLQEGHMDIFKKHANNFLMHSKTAITEMPEGNELGKDVKGHLQAAIEEAQKALVHAEAGQEDVAVDHALGTLSHTEEAYSLSDAL
jgi:thiamine phosphate synthase YjbQ (UPF0047 family)